MTDSISHNKEYNARLVGKSMWELENKLNYKLF